jgi:superfamily I DNA and RNA helicase
MQFLVSLGTTYINDQASKNIWDRLSTILKDTDGICYYRHPSITSSTNSVPDLTLLAYGYQPIIIKCLSYNIDEIQAVDEETWSINDQEMDSPLLELDDYSEGLNTKFGKKRNLRRRLEVIKVVVLPFISEVDFRQRFNLENLLLDNTKIIWSNLSVDNILVPIPIDKQLNDDEWQLAKSVFQGVALDKGIADKPEQIQSLGKAIIELEKQITLLDPEQHKAAVQIAPGPQRIRGLAGTGKTVVLAKKAAIIHNTPELSDKRILFTFNTQSLYNQAKSLISKYYRDDNTEDPDWEGRLHIRHGWGSSDLEKRSGVYSDICKRYELPVMSLMQARRIDAKTPFRACCKQILNIGIEPFYDYIIVDEAQDFPPEFFQILFQLCIPNEQTGLRCIYWAYDELQSLSSLEIPGATELFGLDNNGNPNININGEDYPGGMEKDIVLRQSYRCPQSILMLAHGIGLGIYAPRGCVQMLSDKVSWSAIGYDVVAGSLVQGEDTVIVRPEENSPNKISEQYEKILNEKVINIEVLQDIDEELVWVSKSIYEDITVKKVPPEKIVVVSLDQRNAISYFQRIQSELHNLRIRSLIPGLIRGTADFFAESGAVTLSTVWKAKGNEAPIIYIINFDYLYQYAEEIESRNRAFTSISRSKGWIRISGSGKQMLAVKKELDTIIKNIPYFQFKFPDMEMVRRLDATETSRRRKQVKTVEIATQQILKIDDDALASLSPEMLKKLEEKVTRIREKCEEVEDED